MALKTKWFLCTFHAREVQLYSLPRATGRMQSTTARAVRCVPGWKRAANPAPTAFFPALLRGPPDRYPVEPRQVQPVQGAADVRCKLCRQIAARHPSEHPHRPLLRMPGIVEPIRQVGVTHKSARRRTRKI